MDKGISLELGFESEDEDMRCIHFYESPSGYHLVKKTKNNAIIIIDKVKAIATRFTFKKPFTIFFGEDGNSVLVIVDRKDRKIIDLDTCSIDSESEKEEDVITEESNWVDAEDAEIKELNFKKSPKRNYLGYLFRSGLLLVLNAKTLNVVRQIVPTNTVRTRIPTIVFDKKEETISLLYGGSRAAERYTLKSDCPDLFSVVCDHVNAKGDNCGRIFTTKGPLTRHVREIHGEGKKKSKKKRKKTSKKKRKKAKKRNKKRRKKLSSSVSDRELVLDKSESDGDYVPEHKPQKKDPQELLKQKIIELLSFEKMGYREETDEILGATQILLRMKSEEGENITGQKRKRKYTYNTRSKSKRRKHVV